MDKTENSMQELYNMDILRTRVVEGIRAYMANPENETGAFIADVPQGQFNYILCDAGRSVFGGVRVRDDILLTGLLCLVYVELCAKYNKIPSIVGFAMFSGIPSDYIKLWQADAKRIDGKQYILQDIIECLQIIYCNIEYNIPYLISNYHFNNTGLPFASFGELQTAINGLVYARLQDIRENAIKDNFLQAKQQLGAIALVNREYGWSADTVAQTERARALSLADLPKMSGYVNHENRLETSET